MLTQNNIPYHALFQYIQKIPHPLLKNYSVTFNKGIFIMVFCRVWYRVKEWSEGESGVFLFWVSPRSWSLVKSGSGWFKLDLRKWKADHEKSKKLDKKVVIEKDKKESLGKNVYMIKKTLK